MTEEQEHRRLYLSVVDESPEGEVARRYVSLHARRSGRGVALLGNIAPPPTSGEWVSIGREMEEEEHARAEQLLARAAAEVQSLTGEAPERFLRPGFMREALFSLLEEESRIAALVLAAGRGPGSPGPLVAGFSGKDLARLTVPLIIVPEALMECSEEEIARFS